MDPRGETIGNEEVADLLERYGDLLEAQQANGFRVRAYHRAAETCRALEPSLAALYAGGGLKALEELPGIGRSIAGSIVEMLCTGRFRQLERLAGQATPENLFATLPGIGSELARRIHAELGIESLEELEEAAHDGRLRAVPGFGPRRQRALQAELASVLGRDVRRRARLLRGREQPPPRPPSVEALLETDAQYRAQADLGRLHRIAPRRFNPAGEAWLPILHVEREGWYLTAMFSNTARAHELGKTHEWVVIIHERDGRQGTCTVVTEHQGPLAGRRVVRGREAECARVTRSA